MLYKLLKVEHGAAKEVIEIEATGNLDLLLQLYRIDPENTNIQGHNFNYVSYKEHMQAAGYGLEGSLDVYLEWNGPASFNPTFYEIIN